MMNLPSILRAIAIDVQSSTGQKFACFFSLVNNAVGSISIAVNTAPVKFCTIFVPSSAPGCSHPKLYSCEFRRTSPRTIRRRSQSRPPGCQTRKGPRATRGPCRGKSDEQFEMITSTNCRAANRNTRDRAFRKLQWSRRTFDFRVTAPASRRSCPVVAFLGPTRFARPQHIDPAAQPRSSTSRRLDNPSRRGIPQTPSDAAASAFSGSPAVSVE